jgi:hypothetical protein
MENGLDYRGYADTIRAFHRGIKFEMCKNSLLKLVNEMDDIKKSGELEEWNDFAEYLYETADNIAKEYGCVDNLQEHFDLYNRFKELARQ